MIFQKPLPKYGQRFIIYQSLLFLDFTSFVIAQIVETTIAPDRKYNENSLKLKFSKKDLL